MEKQRVGEQSRWDEQSIKKAKKFINKGGFYLDIIRPKDRKPRIPKEERERITKNKWKEYDKAVARIKETIKKINQNIEEYEKRQKKKDNR